jgi:hypothetical protein
LVITQGYEKFIGNAGLCMALLTTQVADLTVTFLKMPIVLKLFYFSNDILVVYATATSNTALFILHFKPRKSKRVKITFI